VVLFDLATRARTTIVEDAGLAYYMPSSEDGQLGHLVFGQDGAVFAAPFDLRSRQVGDRTPLLEGLLSLGPFTLPAVSTTGTLAYLTGESTASVGVLVSYFDRDGTEERLPVTPDLYSQILLAQDGTRFVIGTIDLDRLIADVWLYEIEAGRPTRLIADDDQGVDKSPVWMPDGQRVIFASAANVASRDSVIRMAPTDASSLPVVLASIGPGAAYPSSVSPDGTALIGTLARSADNGDIWVLPLPEELASADGESQISWLVESAADEQHASFSPDGRWIVYSSDESGRDEIYVIPFPGPGGRIPVSVGGGNQPRWNPRGGEIFYRNGNSMMAVSYEVAGNRFDPGTPIVLFDHLAVGVQIGDSRDFQYDVSADGQRFLMLRPGGADGEQAELRVVRNWPEELRVHAPFSSLP
jgi:dipeptidyl aminopeptidase/acylaminoacyl peptidase